MLWGNSESYLWRECGINPRMHARSSVIIRYSHGGTVEEKERLYGRFLDGVML